MSKISYYISLYIIIYIIYQLGLSRQHIHKQNTGLGLRLGLFGPRPGKGAHGLGFGDDFRQYDTKTIILRHFLANTS